MANNLQRHAQAHAASTFGRQSGPMDGSINTAPALVRSEVTRLHGSLYPVQFREQGAVEAWKSALENTLLWPCWQDPATLCWQIRQEFLRQLEAMSSSPTVFGQLSNHDHQRLAFAASMNLKYHLSQGTVIEATPALETLLANSDVDLSLPMSMVTPPYRAQYLRFGDTATRYLKVPNPQSPDHVFEGAFCFLTRHALSGEPREKCWTLELLVVTKRQGCYGGQVSLLGEADWDDVTVGEWLNRVLAPRALPDATLRRWQPTAQTHFCGAGADSRGPAAGRWTRAEIVQGRRRCGYRGIAMSRICARCELN